MTTPQVHGREPAQRDFGTGGLAERTITVGFHFEQAAEERRQSPGRYVEPERSRARQSCGHRPEHDPPHSDPRLEPTRGGEKGRRDMSMRTRGTASRSADDGGGWSGVEKATDPDPAGRRRTYSACGLLTFLQLT